MKRVYADLNDELLVKVKIHCIQSGISQKQFMENLIVEALSPKTKKATAAKKTPAKRTASK